MLMQDVQRVLGKLSEYLGVEDEDTRYVVGNLADQLGQVLYFEYPDIFREYARWAFPMLRSRSIDDERIVEVFEKALSAAAKVLPEPYSGQIEDLKELVGDSQFAADHAGESLIDRTNTFGAIAGQYMDLLLERKKMEALQMIMNLRSDGVDILDIYMNVFQVVMVETGRMWERNELSVMQEHYITAVTQMAMSQLFPHIINSKKTGKNLVSCCIGEELHEIGIRMVSDLFELKGWDSYYVGANTPVTSLINSLKEIDPHILAISVTGTQYFHLAKWCIDDARDSGHADGVKILVGGLAFNRIPGMADLVGADAYAPNALEALQLADKLTE